MTTMNKICNISVFGLALVLTATAKFRFHLGPDNIRHLFIDGSKDQLDGLG